MLNDAELHCRKLLNFLGVNRSDEQIQRAIDYQSFNRAKQRFIDKGEIEKAHFLRAARPEQWRSKLSESQVGLVNSLLKEDLDCLGYS
jgi:hypothetical protein